MFGGRIKLNAPLVWSKHPGPLFSLALYCFNWTLLPDEPAERDEPLELTPDTRSHRWHHSPSPSCLHQVTMQHVKHKSSKLGVGQPRKLLTALRLEMCFTAPLDADHP